MKRIWAEIRKAEEKSDGTMIVSGYASAPTPDSDGETVTSAAMEQALPDYMKFGAVREMHQAKAAGNALEAYVETESGKTFFTAHVVDSEACKKVKNKVYKGFSIGGKVLARDDGDPNVITGIKLVEVSLVDRPANPDSIFTMYKAEDMKQDHPPRELDAIAQLSALVNKGAIVPSKLVALAKAHIQGDKTMNLQKSLWDVAELAALLGQLKSVQSCLAFDAAYEGEISPASMKLKDDIANLANTLIALVGEEVPEASGMMEGDIEGAADPAVNDQVVTEEEGAKEIGTEEAGDATDQGDQPEAQKDDSVMEEAEEGDEEGEKANDGNDGHMAQPKGKPSKKSEGTGDLAKMVGDAVKAAVDPLLKRIKDLEAQPAPSKAMLKVVGKGQDIQKAAEPEDDRAPEGLSAEEQAAWDIKKLHRTGGLL